MSNQIIRISKKLAALSYIIGAGSLIVGILLSIIHLPASAAASYDEGQATATATGSPLTCTPPDGWDKTIRLFYSQTASTQWTFDVEEPEMDVVLQFFYFQDYNRQGCPFDCTTGECQLDEIGKGQSPFGRFTITDGKLGNNDGVIKQQGRLRQGTYQADFHVTGHGSINIGLRVSKKAVTATSTAQPTETIAPVDTETSLPPTENPTATPLTPSATSISPREAPTETPAPTATEAGQTPTEAPATQPATNSPPTASATTVVISPVTSIPPTPTNTETAQHRATKTPRAITPTATPYTAVQPASPTHTALPTRTVGPVNTLAPPPGGSSSTVLIPRTGADLTGTDSSVDLVRRLLLLSGIGLLGLGFVVQSFGNKLSQQ